MKLISQVVMAGALAYGLGALGGCTGPEAPESAEVVRPEGVHDDVTIIEANESAGRLVLAYSKSGREIRYELIMGPEMEAPYRSTDPEQPRHQDDARVMDAKGGVFYLQMGGDHFLDPSWKMPTVDNVDEAGRMLDLQLPREALPAIRALALPGRLSELKKVAIQIGMAVDATNDQTELAKPPSPPIEMDEDGKPAPGNMFTSTIYSSGAAYWSYDIKAQAAVFGFIGDHSAVRLRSFSSAKRELANFYSCNHGACASYSSMGLICRMTGYRADNGTHTRSFYQEYNRDNNTAISGGCTTGYGWVGGGVHVCNDDTYLQRDAIYSNSTYDTKGGTCGDAFLRATTVRCH